MAGYANGADDAEYVDSPNSPGNRSGGSGSILRITDSEIAVIVLTVVVLFTTLVSVFYCRTLRARRDIDIENKARERAERLGTSRGDYIELGNRKRVSGSSTVSLGIESSKPGEVGGRKDTVTPGELESSQQQKPSLRYYIHWKNPYRKASGSKPQPPPIICEHAPPAVPEPAYMR
ncbi:hypothetical protein QBC35DRAFT_450533 [Podospora australis]|uniref:Uncharacterized protein n=1 Tax=Podospora australis TaxID=1536484 RepID=A0AAN7AJS1_9PEZI|nr:hypothetical protein QBC35DRAFT_450533 [Podospora australis]